MFFILSAQKIPAAALIYSRNPRLNKGIKLPPHKATFFPRWPEYNTPKAGVKKIIYKNPVS